MPPLLFVSRVDSKFVDFFVLSGAALKNIKKRTPEFVFFALALFIYEDKYRRKRGLLRDNYPAI